VTAITQAVAERVLGGLGLDVAGLEPRHGWSNAAWIGPTHVVRISSGRLRGSFAHEALVVSQISAVVPVAEVVACGLVDDRHGLADGAEWIVSRRVEGATLAERWPCLSEVARGRVGAQLGAAMQAISACAVDAAPLWWRNAHRPGELHNAYRPEVSLGPVLLDAVAELPDADRGIVESARGFYAARVPAFDGAERVLIHGDLHGHNVMVSGDGDDVHVRAILDWEGAHRGPSDLELDMLLRWVSAAHDMGERPLLATGIAKGDCKRLVADVAAAHPLAFAGPWLAERLEVHDLHWHLVHLLLDRRWRDEHGDDGTRSVWWMRLTALLDGSSPIRHLLNGI
jgi:aminoglycoside phosphotransferase (APT) family kinase protein